MVKRWLYHRSAVLIISYETFRNHVKLFKKVSKSVKEVRAGTEVVRTSNISRVASVSSVPSVTRRTTTRAVCSSATRRTVV